MVQRHLDGLMDDTILHKLQNNKSQWVETLFRFLEQTDRSIARVRREHRGIERRTVLDDLNSEADRIDKVLTDILGPCLLYTSPSPRDLSTSRMPSSA